MILEDPERLSDRRPGARLGLILPVAVHVPLSRTPTSPLPTRTVRKTGFVGAIKHFYTRSSQLVSRGAVVAVFPACVGVRTSVQNSKN